MSSHESRPSRIARSALSGVMVLLVGCHHAAVTVTRSEAALAPPLFRAWNAPCPSGSWRPDMPSSEFHADATLAGTIEGHIVGVLPFDSVVVAMEARVTLQDLHRETVADRGGAFQFRDVPAGQHILQTAAIYFARRVDTLTMAAPYGWRLRLAMPQPCRWPI